MSGFQDIAAAIGIAELALRSISRVYEFVRYMKDAPESVTRLCAELCELDHCLSELTSLGIAGSPTQAVFSRLELSATLSRCGDICTSLETNLYKWTRGGRETVASRFRVRFNKAHIESAVQDISSTKHTIILAVSTASIRMQSEIAAVVSGDRRNVVACRPPVGPRSPTASSLQSQPPPQSTTRTSEKHPMSATTIDAGTLNLFVSHDSGNIKGDTSRARDSNVRKDLVMEDNIVHDNKVTDSTDTKIGAPGYLAIKKQTVVKNEIVGSQNTYLGIW